MSRRENVKKMLRLSQSQWKPLAAGTFFLFVAAGLNLSFPMLIGFLIDDIEFGSQAGQETLNGYILSLLGLFFFVGIATFFRAYLFVVAGERIVANLRREVFTALIGQEIGFFDLNRTGSLTNRLASDTTVVQNAVTVNLSMALRFSLSGLGSILILFYMSWQLTMVMLITVPLVAVAATYYGRMLQRISVKVQDALAESTAIAEEGFSNIRTVRAFARETFEQRRYGAAVEQSFQIAKKRALIAASFQGLLSFAGYGAICGVLWYGGLLLIEGELAFGALTSFILYTFTVAFSISALSGLFGDFAKALGASERIFSFLDRATTIQDGQREVVEAKGNLRFQDVVFAYPTRPEFPVLRTFSLSLSNGEVVALVGPSGGGKSTVAALVSRFYDPQSGIITFDEVPIHQLKKDWLRAQLGIVSQEPILFATSILDNIRYGRLSASQSDIEAAARAANAHDFISSFPEGYQTMVGERGVRLSGGQKQRIAIARALLKDPKILILDEATSALDVESEHLVQEALERLMKGRTTLVIAHRLSTIQDADRVAVLDQGKIVEEGTHTFLMDKDGVYKRLIEGQFRFTDSLEVG